ncbi:MAG: glycosyltransferase family 2 protein [Lachnospiraceae bacterium]|nr:glycosyltransferase family 2 protein [Lachnospiraceae bacterium]
MNQLVSIIIPIFNADKYLERCLESVLSQTYYNLDIILIDDGSTDNSKKICEKYRDKDQRITYIYQLNKGNTAARKTGMSMARGKYVTFVDADDWIEPNCIEALLLEVIKSKADVVMSNIYEDRKEGLCVLKNHITEGVYNNPKDITEDIIFSKKNKGNGLIASLSGKLYSFEFAKEALSTIDDDMHYGEDYSMTFWCALNARCICIVHDAYYHYEENIESYSHTFQEDIFLQMHLFYNYSITLFKKHECDTVLREDLLKCIMGILNRQTMISTGKSFMNEYRLPDLKLKKNAKIILYGAGKVGKIYHEQLLNIKELTIIAWVDKNCSQLGMKEVQEIECINKITYDYIIIAVADIKKAYDIKFQLKVMGVPEKKIIWDYPI